MGGTGEEAGRDSRLEGDASERVRPRSQGGKAGERPPEEQGGFLSPYLPQPTASWWFLLSEQRGIRPFLHRALWLQAAGRPGGL